MKPQPGCQSFFLRRGKIGCLLIHGFTASPYGSRRWLPHLKPYNYSIYGVRLAGHGTTLADMIKTGWEDWWASVEAGYYKLTEICNKIFVGGHSMGGSLALHLAAHHPEVAGVVSICAPAYLEGVKFKLLPIIKLFKKYVKKRPEMLAREEKYDKVYDKFPLPCVHSLYKFLAHLRDDLPKVIVPTIIFQAVNDELIPIQSAEYIYNHISAQYKTLIWLNHSYHSIDNKQDRTKLIKNTIKFIHTHS